MSLTEQIKREQHAIHHLEEAVAEARRELWDANFIRRHDEQRPGESDEHWQRRRARNKQAYEGRDQVVRHLLRKRTAHEHLRDDLRDKRLELKDAHAATKAKFEKGATGIVTFDGVQVVEHGAWALDIARQHGWGGVLVSGYRTPEYSISLCQRMCGAPACPGTCGGASSNHARTSYAGPAMDVTDYFTCERVLIEQGTGFFNELPYDLVHMSQSGH